MGQASRTCSVEGCDGEHHAKGLCKPHWTRQRREAVGEFSCSADDCGAARHQMGLCRKHYRADYLSRAPECSIEDCVEPASARGWCGMHYIRWRKHGSTDVVLKPPSRKLPVGICTVEGCGRVTRNHLTGLCEMHYKRWRIHGEPGGAESTVSEPYRGRACAVDGCSKRARHRGWCGMHYHRWKAHGTTDAPARPDKPRCLVPGCGKVHIARELCPKHYVEWKLSTAPPCCEPGCERPTIRRDGRCEACHRRKRRQAGLEARPSGAPRPKWRLERKRKLWERQHGRCGICALPISLTDDILHVDHIVPVSAGGHSHFDNVQLVHRGCNFKKWKHPADAIPPDYLGHLAKALPRGRWSRAA